jgi:hypothetical protein
MDPELIATVMDQARQQLADDAPHGRDRSASDVQAVGYAPPTAPDAHGFVAIGELHEPARGRLGIVLWHPATGSVRLTWAADAAER